MKKPLTILIWFLVLCLLGPLSVKLHALPFSLQSLFILMTPYLFNRKTTFLLVGAYIASGALGLPVFVGYSAGLDKLTGPTSGFIWGFLVVVVILGLLPKKRSFLKVIPGLFFGHLLLFALGSLGFYLITQKGLGFQVFLQFLPAMVIKSAIGSLLVHTFWGLKSHFDPLN